METNTALRKDETIVDKQKEPTEADVYSFEVDPAQVIRFLLHYLFYVSLFSWFSFPEDINYIVQCTSICRSFQTITQTA